MGYNLTIFTPAILIFMAKALLVVLSVALIGGILEGIRRSFFKEESIKWLKVVETDASLKGIARIALVAVSLLVAAFVFRALSVVSIMGGNPVYMMTNLINITIRVLAGTLLLSLILSLILSLKKKYLVSTNENNIDSCKEVT